jgi:CubicO group peptidase (beta-lactamase class C family)
MDAQTQWTGLDAGRLERITEHFERNYIGQGKIAGCQIAVSRHGHLAYQKSFGLADIERGKAMGEDAIFRIYSMTKPITSVALMQLYERGFFQLNDPVSRFIPSWKNHQVWVSGRGAEMVTEPPRRPMSMRDVLCHTSGITYGNALAALGAPDTGHPVDAAYAEHKVRRGRDETLTDFVGKLANVPLMYHPGEQWMYSLSTDICGALVEIISGQRFDKYLAEHIFKPLGMTDTAFYVAADKAGRLTANYRRGPDKKLHLIDDPATSDYLDEPAFFSGGGGLTSTLADYLRFTEMLRRGGELDGARILGPRTIDLMKRNHLRDGKDLTQMALGSFSETANEGVGFGLGFATVLDEVTSGGMGAGDFYWGGAASTIFWVDQKEDLCAVFMTQFMPSGTFNFRGQLKQIVYSSIVD